MTFDRAVIYLQTNLSRHTHKWGGLQKKNAAECIVRYKYVYIPTYIY